MGRDTRDTTWYCCQCGGFWSFSLYYACIICHHRRGPCCTYKQEGKFGRSYGQRLQGVSSQALPTKEHESSHLTSRQTNDIAAPKTSDARPTVGADHPTLGLGSLKDRGNNVTGLEQLSDFHDQQNDDDSAFTGVPKAVCDIPTTEVLPKSSDRIAMVRLPATPSLDAAKRSTACPLEFKFKPGVWTQPSGFFPLPAPSSGGEDIDYTVDVTQVWSASKHGSSANISDVQVSCAKATIPEIERRFLGDSRFVLCLRYCFSMPESQLPGFTGTNMGKKATGAGRTGEPPEDTSNVSALVNAVWPLIDVLAAADKVLLGLLTQILYSALSFGSTGYFRSCGSGEPPSCPETSASKEGTITKARKRRTGSDGDEESNQGDDNDRKSRKVKEWGTPSEPANEISRRFACLHFKRNGVDGNETSCAGWSNPNIDTVLRVCWLFPS